jgi:aspartyl-tRNA(Asn)/glutamyl-tRNA(Gln) amidotransferase subunit B
LNRAGTPLLEIVSEPEITGPEEAVRFGRTLHRMCRHLGVTQGIMQRGHMRFEPNINVAIDTPDGVVETAVVEIKNLNSFRALHDAIAHEHRRQVAQWIEDGRPAAPEDKRTRGWNDEKGVTFLQRSKEEAPDYRYFPDPDLLPVRVTEDWLERVRAALPELPQKRERRYREALGLSAADAAAVADEPAVAAFFDEAVAAGGAAKRVATLLRNQAARRANERGCSAHALGITATQMAELASLIESQEIGSVAVDPLFDHCCQETEMPRAIAEREGLLQVSEANELAAYVDEVLAAPKNEKAVADIRGGKDKAVGPLIGQVMKKSGGQANPQVVSELIRERARS